MIAVSRLEEKTDIFFLGFSHKGRFKAAFFIYLSGSYFVRYVCGER